MPLRPIAILSALLMLAAACGDDESPDRGAPADAGPSDSGARADARVDDAGAPVGWQECGAPTCRVALETFVDNAGAIPDCPTTKAAAGRLLVCARAGVSQGACDGLDVVRVTYGFPGDHFDCVYDAAGALVGARWAPDHHPTQEAGRLPGATCALGPVTCPDGGRD